MRDSKAALHCSESSYACSRYRRRYTDEGPSGWRRLMVLKMLGLVVDVVIAQAASYYFRSKLRMNGLNMVGSKKGQEKMWKR